MDHARNHRRLQVSLISLTFLSLAILQQAPLSAQQPDSKPTVGFGVEMTGPGGLYTYAPNRWGVMHVNLVNRLETPLELLSSTYFDDQQTLQFGRQIWLPARSKLQSWHPVKIPEMLPENGTLANFHSLVMDRDGTNEVLIRTDSGQMQHAGSLYVSHEMITGVIDSLEDGHLPKSEESMELVASCRMKQALSRKISTVTDALFVPGQESLQPLDQLIICDSRPTRDAAGIAAIRQWLNAGGHLWVMLDQVDPELLEMLLGDDIQCEVVDRVSLNSIHIAPGPAGVRGSDSDAVFEQPVDLVRTVVAGVDLAYTVNDWPAAFWKDCGKGRLLVTTLGPRGWLEDRKPAAAPRRPGRRTEAQATPETGPDPEKQLGKHIPNDPMSYLCMDLWARRKIDPISPVQVEPLVQEYVGYAIPSRWLIVSLLSGFCGLLALAGFCLWRRGRMEWLGGIAPVLAVGVSLILIGIGQKNRQSVPATNASVQFIQIVEGTDDFLAEGQAGIYTPNPGQATLGGHAGGWMLPDMRGQEGTTRRMIWSDLDHWQWTHLPAAAGSRTALFSASNAMSQRVTAKAVFGPNGLTGRLQTSDGEPAEDLLIASNSGRIGVDLHPDGTFTARTANVFGSGKFLSAELLSDEQNRRRHVLEDLLTNPKRKDYPAHPMLYFWTKPWDLGFEFAADSRPLGAALVAVPLELQRPPVGIEVSIPAPLLKYKVTYGPDGSKPTGMWDQLQLEWSEKSVPSSSWLRFQVPEVLLPVQPLGGRIVVSVLGPIGKLEIHGVGQGRIVPLKTWVDPVGTVEFQIPDGEFLTPDASGGILLRIGGGDAARPELTRTATSEGEKISYWRIESLRFDLKAKTLESPW
jgi:hypothetical protein